ncbi:hypothetical protein EPR50_G00007920 [Perca flavescens]|uniref:Uncharacterized protein n=1 Tax=Perca flavescens TaxID=8167 RepID=A0A484DQT5_PERFV|nr:hypothetical protein EPR50_G00007920 [Perca flavescens]
MLVDAQCLSPSIPTLLPFALLSWFFPREPAEVPPGRRFCPIHSDCRNPWTAARNLPALLLLPHGPAFLRRSCCCCCRRRRVEGDPDPTLFLRPDKKRTKKPTRRRLQCVVVALVGRVAAAAAAAGRLPGLLERL